MATAYNDAEQAAFEPDIEGFVAFLREEETKSQDDWLAEERANAIDFYNGEPFGDEEDGRSQLVTRDVAEVIDYMTVSLLRTMVSGDKVVEFDCSEPPRPVERDDQGNPASRPPSMSEQVTIAVTREFMQGQNGYRLLHDWIKAGLLEKASVAKVCVIPQPPKRREAVLSLDEMAGMADQGVEFIASAQMDDAGQQWAVAWLEPQAPKFRDYVSPNEETCIAQDATDLDDDCVYLGFHSEKTLSQLAEMGFDTGDLSDNGATAQATDILSNARDQASGQYRDFGFNRTGANRKVIYHEEYSLFDLNGDGIAERILSHRVGNQILARTNGELAIDAIEDQPGVVWCPFPMQHRIVGQSLADKVMDIQRTNSVVLRQTMDGFYFANNPRTFISEGSMGDTTIDDLLTVRAGGVVRYVGAVKPDIMQNGMDPSAGIALMEKLNGEKESRTGITRLNQGIDADALNKTATGTALMQAQGQQIEEYLARNFAEAFARLMLKKYRLMRQFGQPFEMVIDDMPVTIDPRQWPEDVNVVVRVGLGSGRKDQRVQYRTMLLEIAQAAMGAGSRVFSDTNLYNNIKGLIADANLGNVRELATDPDSLPPAEEKPDPEMMKAQADAQIRAADLQGKQQEAALNLQLKQEESQARIQLMREEAAAKLELEHRRQESEAALALRQQDFEMGLAREQMELQREQAAHKASIAEQSAIDKKRPGGDLDK